MVEYQAFESMQYRNLSQKEALILSKEFYFLWKALSYEKLVKWTFYESLLIHCGDTPFVVKSH